MNWTEVIDVEFRSNAIKVWVGRKSHYIQPGDTLTFVGDSHPQMFENGRDYVFAGRSREEPTDCYAFDTADGEERIVVYKEDIGYCLLNGCFAIHGA